MPKIGHVIDAQTADAIRGKFEKALTLPVSLRPVIWPESQCKSLKIKSLRPSSAILDRSLLHLICGDESILGIGSVVNSETGRIMMLPFMCSYEGAMGEVLWGSGNDISQRLIFFNNDPANMKDFETEIDSIKLGLCIFDTASSLKSLFDRSQDSTGELMQLPGYWLFVACWLEQFAFSSYAIRKEKPIFKPRYKNNLPVKEWPAIEIVHLRPLEKTENENSEGRVFSFQFPVIGHFRNQRCGKNLSETKRIWIDSHIRGPKDAPMKPNIPKVYKVTR